MQPVLEPHVGLILGVACGSFVKSWAKEGSACYETDPLENGTEL